MSYPIPSGPDNSQVPVVIGGNQFDPFIITLLLILAAGILASIYLKDKK